MHAAVEHYCLSLELHQDTGTSNLIASCRKAREAQEQSSLQQASAAMDHAFGNSLVRNTAITSERHDFQRIVTLKREAPLGSVRIDDNIRHRC